MIVVRVRHPQGTLKLEIESPDTSTTMSLYEMVADKLGNTYPDSPSFLLHSRPEEVKGSRLVPSKEKTLTAANIKHGDMFYMCLNKKEKSQGNSEVNSKMEFEDLDSRLQGKKGMIERGRDDKFCKHGPIGMCEHCQPLEPYDSGYSNQQGTKHFSFYSWLKKLRDASNTKIPMKTLLGEEGGSKRYTIDLSCPFHPPYPAGICTKCQPSAITLKQQPFRMVDHVEIASRRIIDEFLTGWRSSGYQRFAWLIGRYEEYEGVPLGIKAVVEAVYEPSQDGSIDGFHLVDGEGRIPDDHQEILKALNLKVVGMIYTDLIDDGSGNGRVLCRRSADTFFLSSTEVSFIAHQQALHPCSLKFPENDGIKTVDFSSRFVSVVVSGEVDGGIGLKAYQVSESAVGMEEAGLIQATTDPSKMMVCKARGKDNPDPEAPLYVPQVFYKYKNTYGIEVQEAASPFFPVEYLLVTLSEGIPVNPQPFFKSPLSFPAPCMHPSQHSLSSYLKDYLSVSLEDLAKSDLFSNLNFCLYVDNLLEPADRSLLLKSVRMQDSDALLAFLKSNSWSTLQAIVVNDVFAQDDSARVNDQGGVGSSDEALVWSCTHCTFVNESKVRTGELSCEMCGLPKQ